MIFVLFRLVVLAFKLSDCFVIKKEILFFLITVDFFFYFFDVFGSFLRALEACR